MLYCRLFLAMLQTKEIKMSRTIFLSGLLIILLITGCSPFSTSEQLKTPTLELTKSNLPSPNGEWTSINMTHSGGIMGLSRSIAISSDGTYTVTDERANKTIAKKLSANELTELNKLIASSKSITTNGPRQSGCADCFIYNLEIQGDGKNFSAQVDDVTMPKSGMEPLIIYLRGLVDSALK